MLGNPVCSFLRVFDWAINGCVAVIRACESDCFVILYIEYSVLQGCVQRGEAARFVRESFSLEQAGLRAAAWGLLSGQGCRFSAPVCGFQVHLAVLSFHGLGPGREFAVVSHRWHRAPWVSNSSHTERNTSMWETRRLVTSHTHLDQGRRLSL